MGHTRIFHREGCKPLLGYGSSSLTGTYQRSLKHRGMDFSIRHFFTHDYVKIMIPSGVGGNPEFQYIGQPPTAWKSLLQPGQRPYSTTAAFAPRVWGTISHHTGV